MKPFAIEINDRSLSLARDGEVLVSAPSVSPEVNVSKRETFVMAMPLLLVRTICIDVAVLTGTVAAPKLVATCGPMSVGEITVVCAEAVSFAGPGSVDGEDAELAVPVMIVPGGAVAFTFTVITKFALEPAVREPMEFVQLIVPVPFTAGVMHVQPGGGGVID